MTDALEERLSTIDGPRRPDPEFRAQLERALIEGSAAEPVAEPRWRIDGPRAIPPSLRARVEAAMVRRRRTPPRLVTSSIAAAIALLLLASSMVLVSSRAPEIKRPAAVPAPTMAPTVAPTTAAPKKPRPKPPGSLRAFSSSGEFLRYVRAQALGLTGPYGIQGTGMYGFGDVVSMPTGPVAVGAGQGGAPAQALAPSAPQGHSATNIQEEGVDEPDIVKTDGKRLVVLSGSNLSVIDVRGDTPKRTGTLAVPNATGTFLAGNRVVVFSSQYGAPTAAIRATHVTERGWTTVTVVSIAEPSSPHVVSRFEVEGSYVGARLARGVVRLIIQSGALGPPFAPLVGQSESQLRRAETKNKSAVRHSSVGDWVPHFILERFGRVIKTGHVHSWSAISRPAERGSLSMLTMLTIDPDNPRPDNAVSVLGAGEIIYSSLDRLYVTSNSLNDILAAQRGTTPPAPVTHIHTFDIRDPSRARYVGSGKVPGFLLNQFSMSERDGYLRVASTLGQPWRGPEGATTKSFVTVLARKADRLLPIGSVGDLGKGERIYSVRFIGSMGYVVTFRQVDPLYVIDLHDPASPKVRGELKVPGYSGYLHPLTDTLLVGVGRDAGETGRASGLQISLFDVADPDSPRRLDNLIEGTEGMSSVEMEHHGFLYWEPRHLIVVPASISDKANDPSPFLGALAVTVRSSSSFGRVVRITHTGRAKTDDGYPEIRRALVVGDLLLTVSSEGILSSDLTTLADRSWLPL